MPETGAQTKGKPMWLARVGFATKAVQRGCLRFVAVVTSTGGLCAIFGILLLIGLFVAKDYGISWDEKTMHVLGEEAYNFVFHRRAYPANIGIRFHGAWFEMLQYALEKMWDVRYAQSVYILRHAVSYSFYWVGLLAMYAIAVRAFKSRSWALLAVLFLFLSPRQFGHAFVNTRDVPAMVCFMIKMLTLTLFLDRPTIKRAVFHGVASGLIMSLRVGGLFVPIYVALFFGILILRDALTYGSVDWKHYAKVLLVYAATFALATVALWPLLWQHPVANFTAAMHNMMTAQSDAGGFYFGKMVTGVLPWHWIPVHLAINTPLLYTTLFCIGVAELCLRAIKRPMSLLEERRNVLLFFLWFTVPIAIVIVLRGHLFDEWRHVYFIYPAFLLLSINGLRALWTWATQIASTAKRTAAQGALIAVCAFSFAHTAVWMIRNHPLQIVYYAIPPHWVEGYFPLDYWGLSYRQGFEWILAHDSSDPITVRVASSPGWENLNMLTQPQRHRLIVENDTYEAKYILDNYQENDYKRVLPDSAELHAIRVSGMDVLGIYRNPKWTPEADKYAERMEDFEVQERFDVNDTP